MLLEEIIKQCGNCEFWCEHWCEKKKRECLGRCFAHVAGSEIKPIEILKTNTICTKFKLRNSE